MKQVVFYLTLPLIYLVSILPFPLLYAFSDFVFLILYYGMGYRKKIVWENLKNAFPEKTDAELFELQKNFYHYLCDVFIESFKTLTISEKKMLKHCSLKKSAGELLDGLYAENRNIILVMGHFGNWEWAGNAFSLTRKHQLYVIYHPLKNKYFNQFIINMRLRFGTKLIKMKDTMRDMLALREGQRNATAFISDQTPQPDRAHWMKFLNQDTPVFLGTEKFSKKLNYPVVYVSVKRMKRGYYEIDCELLFKEPKETDENEITERHTKRLEEDIRTIPFTWLWSHRRWKHKRKLSVVSSQSKLSGE